MLFIHRYTPGMLSHFFGDIADFRVAGQPVERWITGRFPADLSRDVVVCSNFFPSAELACKLANSDAVRVFSASGKRLLAENCSESFESLTADENSVELRYPWDLLRMQDMLMAEMEENIGGVIRERVSIDGKLQLGSGSVILPGVYIEGNVIIGKNCKIGPNCYIRGNTSIGDNCHIGQAVEIKNSIIGSQTAIGHLSYAGDSIIGSRVNFGAGTIIANLRHDGLPHRFVFNDTSADTGRRKFGAVIGNGVHTGIHTAIYPGRFLLPGAVTCPGDIVKAVSETGS